ncbi:S53 family peptidase [Streptomyces sp. PTM05]|uniref:S53 family peptidase n=1 Tax=Streptantibioticus parmotrematis TaxID=2873249 RepID=A0ABS7QUS3_9ACTN|nr:S53 family peptidase [Streptantibioticus parmotrematis]MBY8886956.1 S53 family peptidase [Streptantibioticus parmotrematis]
MTPRHTAFAAVAVAAAAAALLAPVAAAAPATSPATSLAPATSPAPTAAAPTPAHRAPLTGSRPAFADAADDLGAVPSEQTMTARLYLGSRDPAQLAGFLRSVTDPASRSYRHFLTPAAYQRRFALTAAQRGAVVHWLTGSGLRVTASTPHYLQASGTEAALAKALGTGFHRYATAWGPLQAPTKDASVPAAVAGDVIGLDGPTAPAAASPASVRTTAPLPASAATAGRSADAAVCSPYFGQRPASGQPPAYGRTVSYATCPYTPRQLRRAYGAAPAGATGRGRTIAIVGAYGSATMPGDADTYATDTGDRPFRPGQYRQRVDRAHWNTGTKACAAPGTWAGEQALDIEMAHAYAPDADVLYVGANSCLDGDLMDAEASVVDAHSADVISNSWAEITHSNPEHLTPGLVDAWNMLFEQAAAEGIGVYFAAGDCGDSSPAAAAHGLNCDPATTQAQADFPSGSPWVTSVGATTLATTRSGDYAWETSMGDVLSIRPGGTGAWAPIPGVFAFGGGGGRADAAEPWYQKRAVPTALSTVRGAAHRVTPDVSLEGDGALPVLVGYTAGGTFQLVGYGGTSAAAPGFAAIQTDAEQEAGHAFGFANPLLYALSTAGVYHDVTATPTPTAVVRDMGPEAGTLRYLLYTLAEDKGLKAAKGYDEATGLGSPNAAYLRWFGKHH